MMVIGQQHSIKLRIIHEDGRTVVLHYDSRASRDADRAWYRAHGFQCK